MRVDIKHTDDDQDGDELAPLQAYEVAHGGEHLALVAGVGGGGLIKHTDDVADDDEVTHGGEHLAVDSGKAKMRLNQKHTDDDAQTETERFDC